MANNLFKSPLFWIAAAAVGVFLVNKKMSGPTMEAKRAYLVEMGIPSTTVSRFTSSELDDAYTWVAEYVKTGLKASAPADLLASISLMSVKYGIFN